MEALSAPMVACRRMLAELPNRTAITDRLLGRGGWKTTGIRNRRAKDRGQQ
jgi:hypothetical protein